MVFDLKLLKFMYDETFIIKNRKIREFGIRNTIKS